MVRAKDPLLHHGSRRLDKDQKARRAALLRSAGLELLLVALPMAVFLSALALTGAAYHYAPVWTSLGLGALLFAASGVYGLLFGLRWQRWLGRFLMISAYGGTALGLYCYYTSWIYYYNYRDLRRLANVGAAQPAAAFSDAGMLRFTEDSRVDASSSVGYMSLVGKTFCVAPLLDSTMGPEDNVSFYAAGIDCCNARGGFRCDDAVLPDARSGLVILDPSRLVSTPLVAWLLGDSVRRESFEAAVRLQQAVYGTKAAEGRRLIRWAKDPMEMQRAFLREAFLLSGLAAGLLLLLFTVVGLLTAGVMPDDWQAGALPPEECHVHHHHRRQLPETRGAQDRGFGDRGQA